jgi:hypothetical protein
MNVLAALRNQPLAMLPLRVSVFLAHLILANQPRRGPLPDADVVQVIRANAAAVNACYQVAERAGAGTGKAIVRLEIDVHGRVTDAAVDAPAFAGSSLAACVAGRVRAWRFPRFTVGPKRFVYPLVFVGR